MGKRGHHEGSIYRRESDGRWVASIDLGYVNGKRKRKAIYGKTRREVAEKLTASQRDRQLGLPVAPEQQTVAQFLTHWLETVVRPSVRPKTHESYAQLVRLYLIPAIGRHRLTSLTPQHVQSLLNERLSSGLSARTVQYMRAVLRRALGQALKWGLVGRNVATLVDGPRSTRPEVRPLSSGQARQLLDAVRGD